MLLKRIQLGLIHVAVAMTLVPINSTLNRVMINELAISATFVAILASLPYLFSPMQVAIGSYSDRHPFLGLRRTPYIVLGLILCAVGVILSPQVAFLISENWALGVLVAGLAFGAWGMGYNLSSVSYLSLVSELFGENGRGRTVAVMWFMMIVGIILTALGISRMVDPYTPEALQRAFGVVGMAALAIGMVGLVGLEPRSKATMVNSDAYTVREMVAAIVANRQAKLFFWYVLLVLVALLGQDILLEPFAAQAFGLTVRQTTSITSLWGVFVLASILVAGLTERRFPKRTVAQWGNAGALAGFVIIIMSGTTGSLSMFYAGVTLLGVGTGLSTVASLSTMFDLTVPGKVGLYIGAWGMASAFSRLSGSVLGGAVRDVAVQVTQNVAIGYQIVFSLMVVVLLVSMAILNRVDVAAFKNQTGEPSLIERAAMAD